MDDGLKKRRTLSVVFNTEVKKGYAMRKCSQEPVGLPEQEVRDHLTEVLRRGAQDMLTVTIEAEVSEYIDQHGSPP